MACGPKSELAGKYVGGVDFSPEQAKAEIAGAIKAGWESATLEIEGNGNYKLAAGEFTVLGTTRIEGDTVIFTPDTINGFTATEARERLINAAKGKPNEAQMTEGAIDMTSEDRMKLSADMKRLDSLDAHELHFGKTHYKKVD